MNELISIIIPTCNLARLMGETLESIIIQTYKTWEYIVVDDCSTDYTFELLTFYTIKDSRIKFFKRPEGIITGANSCRNYGLKLSKGSLINWFDSDDLMHPEKLSKQILFFKKDNVKMCVCQTMIFQDKIHFGFRHSSLKSKGTFNDYILNRIKWLTQAPILRKDFLLEKDHFYDQDLVQSQEWDYFVRLLNYSIKYEVINEPLVYFRKHNDSILYGEFNSQKIYSFFKARLKVLQFPNGNLNTESRNHLKNSINGAFITMLHKGDMVSTFMMKREIKNLKAHYNIIFRSFQIELAFFSFKVFRKGELFLRFNR